MDWGWSWSSIIALVAIVVSVLLYLADRHSAKQARNMETKQRKDDVRYLEERLEALKEQAAALTRQAEIAERHESIPNWSLNNVTGVVYVVRNENAFTALDVKVESVPELEEQGYETVSIDLGTISAGSSQTFDFILAATSGCPDKVLITWATPESDQRSSVSLPVPRRNR